MENLMSAPHIIPAPPPLEITTVPRNPEVSEELGTSWGEHRPQFTAESTPPFMRNVLALLTVLWAPLLPLLALVAAAPIGEGHGTLFGTAVTVVVALSCALYLVYGSLLSNNRALGMTGRAWWLVAMITAGPIGMLFYWRTHIAEARFVARSRY